MLLKFPQKKRKGSVLVEYGLLIAGVVLTAVLAIAVLGHKIADNFGVMAAIMPGAHAEDNKPTARTDMIPVDSSGATLRLDSAGMVSPAGVDRMTNLLGAGGGELLIVD